MTETELASLEALAKAKAVAWTNQFALDVTSLRGADVPYEQPMWSEPSPDHSIPLFTAAAILSLIEENKRMREALEPFANMMPDSIEPKDALQRKLQEWCAVARAALEPQS